MSNFRWLLYALLGAFFAAVVNVLMKRALQDKATDAPLASAAQGVLMMLTLIVLAGVFGDWSKVSGTKSSVWLVLALGGIASGLSWYFGYRALQLTEVTKATTVDRLSLLFAVLMAFIFLKERPSLLNWVGVVLMMVAAVLVAQKSKSSDDQQSKADDPQHHAVTEGTQTPTQRLPDEAAA